MSSIKNKIAVVTGASSGIGAGIVQVLLESGMKVVGLARRKEKIEKLGEDYKEKLFALKTDVTNEEEILNAFSWIQDNVGSISVFVNSAGADFDKSFDELETNDIRKIIETDVLGVILCTKEAVKNMKANKVDGTIININSVCGRYVLNLPNMSMHHAAKFGITGFTEYIRQDLAKSGSKIRITILNPGFVRTEMTTDYCRKYSFLQSKDIGNAVKYIIEQPQNVHITELTIRPTGEFF